MKKCIFSKEARNELNEKFPVGNIIDNISVQIALVVHQAERIIQTIQLENVKDIHGALLGAVQKISDHWIDVTLVDDDNLSDRDLLGADIEIEGLLYFVQISLRPRPEPMS